MIKNGRRSWPKLLAIIIISFVIVLPMYIQVTGSSTYSKIWIQSNGSKLKVNISPNSANLEVDNLYVYTITLEAVAFAPSQSGFYSLAIRIRFLNSEKTIESDLMYNFDELKIIGSKTQASVKLTIPSAPEFSLALDESLEGQLQYIIYFSEAPFDGDKSEMPPWDQNYNYGQSLGWETIIQGTITNPFINLRSITFIVVVIVFLIASIAVANVVVKKRSK